MSEIYRVLEKDYDEKQTVVMNSLECLKNTLGLSHWVIRLLKGEPPEESNLCSILPQPGYQEAGIFFREDFFKAPPEEQKHALIHELIHLHFERACSALDMGLQIIETDPSTQGALDQIGLNHHLGIEQGVEGLARVLSGFIK